MSYKNERGKVYVHRLTGNTILLLGRSPSPFFHLRALYTKKKTGEAQYVADISQLGFKMSELEEVK